MSFDFGIPGYVRKVIPGLGTRGNNHFDIHDELKGLADKLAADQDVVDLMNRPGWKKILAQYQNIVSAQWEILKTLSLNAHKNAEAIQDRRQLIEACELFMETMMLPAERHRNTAERIKQLKHFEQERRSYANG